MKLKFKKGDVVKSSENEFTNYIVNRCYISKKDNRQYVDITSTDIEIAFQFTHYEVELFTLAKT